MPWGRDGSRPSDRDFKTKTEWSCSCVYVADKFRLVQLMMEVIYPPFFGFSQFTKYIICMYVRFVFRKY